MRFWIACLLCAASADAGPLRPRPIDTTQPIGVLRHALAAVRADRIGDAGDALAEYREAARLGDPASWYNVGELSLRAGLRHEAIMAFQEYLAKVKDPPDRADVERVVHDLETAPPVVTIGGYTLNREDAEADALILVDGVVAGHSPVTIHPTAGEHLAERVSATTYASQPFHAGPGTAAYISVETAPQAGGNVVISGMYRGDRWTAGTHDFIAGERFKLPKGHYTIGSEAGVCAPIEFDVRSATALTYVRVAAKYDPGQCIKARLLGVQSLEVGP